MMHVLLSWLHLLFSSASLLLLVHSIVLISDSTCCHGHMLPFYLFIYFYSFVPALANSTGTICRLYLLTQSLPFDQINHVCLSSLLLGTTPVIQ